MIYVTTWIDWFPHVAALAYILLAVVAGAQGAIFMKPESRGMYRDMLHRPQTRKTLEVGLPIP